MTNSIIDFVETAASRRIDGKRFPRIADRVMNRYDETGTGCLPSDNNLTDNGVDLDVLARALEKGMDAEAFTTALKAGLVDVDAFNNSPYTRSASNRRDFNSGILALADMAHRTRCPVARVLSSVKPLGMVSKQELKEYGVDLTVLRRAMAKGMCGVDFGVALRAGLINVDAFNNSPYTRTRSSRQAFNQGVTYLANHTEELCGSRRMFVPSAN